MLVIIELMLIYTWLVVLVLIYQFCILSHVLFGLPCYVSFGCTLMTAETCCMHLISFMIL